MKNTEKTMDKVVALCKNRGFIFPGSEIYGGLANTWDYGPLGVVTSAACVLFEFMLYLLFNFAFIIDIINWKNKVTITSFV